MDALTVAKGFVNLTDPEKGDLISNLKIQKLLYYAQGFHLAMYNKAMFDEELVAWQYGPVVPAVYHKLKEHGSNPIPLDPSFDFSIFDQEQTFILTEVNNVYGQYSALRLMEMTHSEMPWTTTNLKNVITHDKLKSFFIDYIV